MQICIHGVLIQTIWDRDWWKFEKSAVWSGAYIQSYLNFLKLGPFHIQWWSK
jgi:hypothetical protein